MSLSAPVRRTELESGLRVVTEADERLRSVTLGAWVAAGARDERVEAGEWGASHFLEHLIFKGSANRSARDIALSVESVGGDMNAFTTHEQTAFFVRVPGGHLELAAEILCDVLWNPAFRETELESERQVILEEIGMRDDTPDDLVHDLLGTAVFPGHPLGREVIGSRSSIGSMPRDVITRYHCSRYVPSQAVVAAAGALEHEELVTMIDELSDWPEPSLSTTTTADPLAPPVDRAVVERESEQAHVMVGLRALPELDDDRYALAVLNEVLGGGMSSRLFQEVREERGLAYSVYSYRAGFRDAGLLAVYAGTTPDRVGETLGVVHGELDRLVSDGTVPDDELTAARGHIIGTLVMSLETSAGRMRRVGRSELVERRVPSVDELIRRVDSVGPDDVARVIDRVVRDAPRSLAVVGPGGVDLS